MATAIGIGVGVCFSRGSAPRISPPVLELIRSAVAVTYGNEDDEMPLTATVSGVDTLDTADAARLGAGSTDSLTLKLGAATVGTLADQGGGVWGLAISGSGDPLALADAGTYTVVRVATFDGVEYTRVSAGVALTVYEAITGEVVEVVGATTEAVTCEQDILFHEYLTGAGITVLEAHQGDSGCAVGQWDDLSGNGKHAVQASASLQPTLGTLGGFSTLIFDGDNDYMQSTLVVPAPGTTPTWIHGIARSITWESNGPWLGDGGTTNCMVMRQINGSPNVALSNGTASGNNGGASLNSWVRFEAYFSNTTADYLKLGSTVVTGTALGNLAGATGRRIGFRPGSVYANVEFFALAYASSLPSAGVRSALDSAIVGKFGVGTVSL